MDLLLNSLYSPFFYFYFGTLAAWAWIAVIVGPYAGGVQSRLKLSRHTAMGVDFEFGDGWGENRLVGGI